VVGQLKEDIPDRNGRTEVATATKVKISQNAHNFSCMRHIHAEFGFDIEFQQSANSVTLP